MREGWAETRNKPIEIQDDRDGYVLVNGNHRLTTAREFGVETIFAVVAPECPDWTVARKREDAVLASMKADDLGPFG